MEFRKCHFANLRISNQIDRKPARCNSVAHFPFLQQEKQLDKNQGWYMYVGNQQKRMGLKRNQWQSKHDVQRKPIWVNSVTLSYHAQPEPGILPAFYVTGFQLTHIQTRKMNGIAVCSYSIINLKLHVYMHCILNQYCVK